MWMLGDVLDLSFDRLLTRRLLPVVYLFVVALVVLGVAVGIVGALVVLDGVLALAVSVVAVLSGVVQVLVARLLVEVVAVYFRVADDVRTLREAQITV